MSVVLCTAGYDHTIRFWEALSGICSRTIPSPDSQVNRLCISPDKRYLAAAGHHLVKIYDIKSTNPQPIFTFDGHTNNVTGLAFHCDSKWLATSSEDGSVKIWDVRTANVQRNYNHGSPVNDVVIHPNQGELVSCDRSGTVRVWDLGENRCSHQLIPEEDVSVASVTLATDGSLLCAGNNLGRVFIWRMIQTNDITSLVPICKFSAHGTYITRVLLSPDTKHLATCSADHTARIWAIAPDLGDPSIPQPTKRPAIAATPGMGPGTTSSGAKPNGQGVVGKASKKVPDSDSDDSSAVESSEEEDEDDEDDDDDDEEDEEDEDDSDAETPSSAVKRGDPSKKKQPTNNTASSTSHLPTKPLQNTSLTGGKDDEVNEKEDEQPLPLEMTLQGHQRWVWDCAFSADSAYLVTACSDHYARLWELSTQSIIRQYNGHHRGAVCVALNDTAIS